MFKVIDITTGNTLHTGTEKECNAFKRSHFAKRFLRVIGG